MQMEELGHLQHNKEEVTEWLLGVEDSRENRKSAPPRSPGSAFFFWTVSFDVMVNNQGLTAAHDLERGRAQP